MDKKENKMETYTCVVQFDKRKYSAAELSNLDDNEKYLLALGDKDNTNIYSIKEFEEILNTQRPIDRYVLTYILFAVKSVLD